MTLAEAQAVLDRCRYRDCRFRLAHMADDRLGVAIEAAVEDAYRPGERLHPTRAVAIEGEDADSVLRAAFHAILRFERHEAAEFFLYGDTRPFDPHAGGQ